MLLQSRAEGGLGDINRVNIKGGLTKLTAVFPHRQPEKVSDDDQRDKH